MAKLNYKMQNILDIKYKLEEQAKSTYANAKLILDEEEEHLNNLISRKNGYELDLRNCVMSKIDLLNIKKYEESVEIIKYLTKLQEIKVKKAEQVVELARRKLNEVMIERKTHEKLKENVVEEFRLELNLDERKEVDELVSFKYNSPKDDEENV